MSVVIAHGGDLSEPSGGTDRIAAVVRALTAAGHEVTVVAPTPRDPLPTAFEACTFHAVPVGVRGRIDQPLRAVRVARTAIRLARDRDATLQIEHSTLAGVATLFGARGYVLDMHDLACRSPLYGDLPLGGLLQRVVRGIEGRALRHAREVVVVTDRMADLAAAEWDLPRERFAVVENGYDPAVVAPFLDTPTVPGRVAFLGTLHPKLDAGALLAVADLPAVTDCVVVGDGERRRDLARAARDHPTLRVLGRLPDAEALPLVAGAAVVVNPQRPSDLQTASSPVKLYTYAALGRPMVLTEGPALAAEFAAAGAARLVPPGGEFAAAVATLLADPDARERMGRAARTAASDATWERRAARFVALYGGQPQAVTGVGGGHD